MSPFNQAPEPGNAQFEQIKEAAINDLLDQAWLTGEAAELGVTRCGSIEELLGRFAADITPDKIFLPTTSPLPIGTPIRFEFMLVDRQPFLAGSATVAQGIEPDAKTAVCCGPNTVYFSRVSKLREMVDHIYGRASLPLGAERPHMFLKELSLHLDRLKQDLERRRAGLTDIKQKSLEEIRTNLMTGIRQYRDLAGRVAELFLKEGYTVFFFDEPSPYPEVTFAIPDEQIRDYEDRLSDAEDRLAEFKKKNVGFMPDERGGYYARPG